MDSSPSHPQGKAKRKIRNFMLQPFIQLRVGLYIFLLTLLVGVAVFAAVYLNFYRLYEMILELTDIREEVTQLLNAYVQELYIWLAACLGVYLLAGLGLSIYFTHRLVGPTYAFRRHIKNMIAGNYKSRVSLRNSDAFTEVAEDLNQLAEALESKYSK